MRCSECPAPFFRRSTKKLVNLVVVTFILEPLKEPDQRTGNGDYNSHTRRNFLEIVADEINEAADDFHASPPLL